MTFLRGMSFEGNVTGTYVLVITEDQIQRILLMTGGNMTIAYEADDVVLDQECSCSKSFFIISTPLKLFEHLFIYHLKNLRKRFLCLRWLHYNI